jgi:hypothetical protein
MRSVTRLLLVASLLLVLVPASVLAQETVDPSGHWTGAIRVPAFNGADARDIAIEVDLARSASGALAGTFSQPAQDVKGLPLSKVSVEGRVVTFELKVRTGGGTFRGTIADATKLSGDFTTAEGGYAIPFNLARTGDARIVTAPKSEPIGKELEGTWNGTLQVEGKQERLVLKMSNQTDGTSAGTILDVDGSGVDIPIAVTQTASNVTIDVPSVAASYVAVLKAGNELVGTWTQGPLTSPLTFKRAAQ